jgi:hypothetical protein
VADRSDALVYGGLAIAGLAGVMLLTQKPAAPAGAPPAPPVPGPGSGGAGLPPSSGLPTFIAQAPAGLIVRSGPGTGYAQLGSLAQGTPLQIACQTWGQQVGGSRVWDRLAAPYGGGYVADWWVSTPGAGVFSPGISPCGGTGGAPDPGAGLPPSPTVTLPPTGAGGAIGDPRLCPAGWIIATGCSWGTANYLVEPAGVGLDLLPYNYEPLHRRKRWIQDAFTWQKLGAPRAAIHIVTQAVLAGIGDGPALVWAGIRGQGLIWVNGPPRIWPNTANAGYGC